MHEGVVIASSIVRDPRSVIVPRTTGHRVSTAIILGGLLRDLWRRIRGWAGGRVTVPIHYYERDGYPEGGTSDGAIEAAVEECLWYAKDCKRSRIPF